MCNAESSNSWDLQTMLLTPECARYVGTHADTKQNVASLSELPDTVTRIEMTDSSDTPEEAGIKALLPKVGVKCLAAGRWYNGGHSVSKPHLWLVSMVVAVTASFHN